MSDNIEQRFVTGGVNPDTNSELHKYPVLNDEEELLEMKNKLNKDYPNVKVRGIQQKEGNIMASTIMHMAVADLLYKKITTIKQLFKYYNLLNHLQNYLKDKLTYFYLIQ